jgi:hypothetical protein
MRVEAEDFQYLDLPPLQNVPLVLPYAQGAGLLLTLPITSGDPCLLIFADRPIANVAEHGGIQPPDTGLERPKNRMRSHHLSDAICIPGFITRPQAVPAYSAENIELRDKERNAYISLGPAGIEITDGTALWKMSGGMVEVNAPAGNYLTAPNINMRKDGDSAFTGALHVGGQLSSAADMRNGSGTTLGTHTHKGVQTGNSSSGSPNAGT